MSFSVWVALVEACKQLIESSHFSDEEIERADSQFFWGGLLEVAYLSIGLSLIIRICSDHLCIFYIPCLIIENFCSFVKGVTSKMLILGRWVFTESLSSLLWGAGTCDTQWKKTEPFSIDKASYFL